MKKGTVAGHIDKKGYVQIRVNGKMIFAHRLAWFMHYGEWPERNREIDHINRNKTDNRISNLRIVSRQHNNYNSSKSINGGVCRCNQTGKWKAYLTYKGKQIWLGRHRTKKEALLARKSMFDTVALSG